MPVSPSIDINTLCNTLLEKNGIVSDTAKAMGITSHSIFRLAKQYPRVQEAIDDGRIQAQLELIDKLEVMRPNVADKLQEKIDGGDTTAIIFASKKLLPGFDDKPKEVPQSQNLSDLNSNDIHD